jgi:hypothetical protein
MAISVVVVSQILESRRTLGDLQRRRVPILQMGFLDTSSLAWLRLSMLMASLLFKAVGVGVAMPRITLIAGGQCRVRSSVSTSTVWRGITSLPGAPTRPDASSASARSTGRGAASISVVVRPGAFPRTVHRSLLGVVSGVVLLEATMVVLVRTSANSILVAVA